MRAQRYADLSAEQRIALEPMARMLRANGVEPTHVFYDPGCTGVRRRVRQAKRLAYKRATACSNRLKGIGGSD